MRTFDQRKSPRIHQSFRVKFLRQGVEYTLEGTTANLSQKGAFIRTKDYRSFQTGEPGEFTFFLPPDFTGQDKVVGLQGNAVITRIDQDNEGIGVKLLRVSSNSNVSASRKWQAKLGTKNLPATLPPLKI